MVETRERFEDRVKFMIDRELLARILDGRKELRSLPQTLAEVLKLARDEETPTSKMADAIGRDPAMTAKLLRLVNSPYYGMPRKVTSISQAVMTLGMRQVTALALSTSVYSTIGGMHTSLDRLRFWRHSLETAIGCRMIGKALGRKNVEELYIAGLLHDIGLLILEGAFPKEFPAVWRSSRDELSLVEHEEQAWGTNHALVGQFLLEQWSLPESICGAVGRHHMLFPPGSCHEELIPGQIVALANSICRFRLDNDLPSAALSGIETRSVVRESLGLSEPALREIEISLFPQTVSEAKFLEIEIGNTEDLLIEANRLMCQQYIAVEQMLGDQREVRQQLNKEQLRLVKADTLRKATQEFSAYVETVSNIIRLKADTVSKGISNGAIIDQRGVVLQSLATILKSVNAVSLVMQELNSLANLETSNGGSSDARFTAAENRIRTHVQELTTA